MSMGSDEIGLETPATPVPPDGSVVYFDGKSSRRRLVTLAFADQLELNEPSQAAVHWPYVDIRRADGPAGTLRLICLSAPALARLEIRNAALAAEVISRCTRLDENQPGRRGAATVVAWSLAAAVSIVAVVMFGVPLAADRLTPLVPQSFERRMGDVADGQVKALFGKKVCNNAEGQAAFTKLVNTLRDAAGLDPSIQTAVLATPIPNAFALPGGRVYLFSGLLAKADNADE
ncbi:MAG TPA: M48 family metalloprotease, partial [Bradyrhizobium sp.]